MKTFAELISTEEFLKELSLKENKDDVISLFAQNGIEMSDEDYIGLRELINGDLQPEGEITESDLDSISGGAWYKYKCSCGKKFATEYFSGLHAVYYNAKKIFCGDGGFKFCTSDGHTHTVEKIK